MKMTPEKTGPLHFEGDAGAMILVSDAPLPPATAYIDAAAETAVASDMQHLPMLYGRCALGDFDCTII